MRIALDTNILIYAENLNDDARARQAVALLDQLVHRDIVLPSQVTGEFYFAISRKFRLPAAACLARTADWRDRYETWYADEHTFTAAFDLAAAHNLQFWDALVLATAAVARCRLLLSEDLQDGFVYRGCTVANPFQPVTHPLLRDALEQR